MKNKKIIVGMCLALFAIFGLLYVAFPTTKTVLNNMLVSNEADLSFDPTDLSAVGGFADHVFVAKVLKVEGVYYEKNTDGTTSQTPDTMFRLKVIENIKGNLSTSKPVLLYKQGGELANGNSFVPEGDTFPEVGSYYILLQAFRAESRRG